MEPNPIPSTEKKKKKKRDKGFDGDTAFVIGSPSSPGVSSSPSLRLQSSSYDQNSGSLSRISSSGSRSTTNPLLMGNEGSDLDQQLRQLGVGRLSGGLGAAGGGYGALLSGDPYSGLGEEDSESTSLLQPATANYSGAGAGSYSGLYSNTAPVALASASSPGVGAPSAQDMLARLMAAQKAGSGRGTKVGLAVGDMTPESQKSQVHRLHLKLLDGPRLLTAVKAFKRLESDYIRTRSSTHNGKPSSRRTKLKRRQQKTRLRQS
jgi:hypothetical protein